MSSSPSEIEKVVSIFLQMEKELDEVEAQVAEMRKKIIEIARTEGGNARRLAVEEATRTAETIVAEAGRDAEERSAQVLSESSEVVKVLKTRIKKVREQAVSLVEQAVLGE